MAHVATITIDHTQVSADLTDFVVYVNLADLPSSFWSVVADGGGDIRVFKDDDTTELPREVVSCVQASDTGELHIKYTGTLSSSVDTDIHIYADGTSSDYAVTATYGRNAVWTGYNAVYHFAEASGNIVDSTGNGNTGTASGSFTYNAASSKLGSAIDTGATSYFNIGDSADTRTAGNDMHVSMWLKHDTISSANTYPLWKNNDYIFLIRNSSSDIIYGNYGNDIGYNTPSGITAGTWYHYVGQTDWGVSTEIFWQGASVAGPTTVTNTGSTTGSSAWVGFRTGNNTDVQFDELRFSDTLFGDDWIATEYTNQNTPTTFYTATAAGGGGGGGTNVQINIGDSWKSVDAMKINIGDVWKNVAAVKINVGDVWKDVF